MAPTVTFMIASAVHRLAVPVRHMRGRLCPELNVSANTGGNASVTLRHRSLKQGVLRDWDLAEGERGQ